MARCFLACLTVHKAVVILMVCQLNTLWAEETEEPLNPTEPLISTLPSVTPGLNSSSPTETSDNFTTEQPNTSTIVSDTTNTPFTSSVTPTETSDNFTIEQPVSSTFTPNTTNTPFTSSVTPTGASDNFTTEQPNTSTIVSDTTNTPFTSSVTPTETSDNFTIEQPVSSTFTPNTTNTPFISSVTPTETSDIFTTEQPVSSTFTPNTTNTPFTTPAFETPTTEQMTTGTFFTVDRTETTTSITPGQTTRLSSTPSPEGTSSGPTDSPNVPSDRPPIFENHPNKTILVEVAISEASTSCQPDADSSSKECEDLIVKFKTGVEKLYSTIVGFLRVEVLQLRKGSVIIRHNAVYNYTAMTPEDQTLTAELVFERTVGPAVTEGKLGNLSVVECTDCNSPKDTSDFCTLISEGLATCADSFLEPQCVNGYVICRSPCKGTPDYCNQHGVCSHADDAGPVCQCMDSNEAWYRGTMCDKYISKIWVIVGCCFGGVFLIIVVAIVLYTCCRRCQNRNLKAKRTRSFLSDGEDFEGEIYMLNCNTIDNSLIPGRSDPSNNVTAFSGGHDGPAITFGKQEARDNDYVEFTDERKRPQPKISSYCQDVPIVELCMDEPHAAPGGSDAAAVKVDTPPTPRKTQGSIYF